MKELSLTKCTDGLRETTSGIPIGPKKVASPLLILFLVLIYEEIENIGNNYVLGDMVTWSWIDPHSNLVSEFEAQARQLQNHIFFKR